MLLSKGVILSLFTFAPQTTALLDTSLIVNAMSIIFMMMTYVYIVGIFRSGGDTKFCMFTETFCVWAVGITTVYFGVQAQLPVYWIVALMQVENIAKLLICIPRYYSWKWIKNLVKG